MTQKVGIMRRIKGTMLRNMHGMITCQEFEDFILSYLDGELTAKQIRVFEWHLRLCRECREYLAAYRRAMEISKGASASGTKGLPDDVPEDLVTAVLEARDK